MANEQNLIPIRTKKEAREKGRNGGKKTSLTKKLSMRKYCDSKCPIWETCWARPTSESIYKEELTQWNREKRMCKESNMKFDEKKPKKQCYLKNADKDLIRTTVRFIEKGEEAFNEELIELSMRLKEISNMKNPLDVARLSKDIRENKKAIWGDRRRIDAKVDGSIADADRIREIFEESKEDE